MKEFKDEVVNGFIILDVHIFIAVKLIFRYRFIRFLFCELVCCARFQNLEKI